MEDNGYDLLAEETRKLFQSFVDAGFTEDQALTLTSTQYSFALLNHQIYERKASDKNEALRRALTRRRDRGTSETSKNDV